MTSLTQVIKNCASNIKKIRGLKNLTQSYIAEKIGLTEKYISDIETGRNPCSLETLVSIANVLEVEPYELLMPENKSLNYDSRRTKIVMQQLKNNFSEMVDSLEKFLNNES